MAKAERVKPENMQPGDVFVDGAVITAVYHDPYGTWIETDDGECGYLDRRCLIERD